VSDIDEVLERLDREGSFREALRRNPQAALAGYDLTTDDLRVLAGHETGGDGGRERALEQRLGKSALFTLLARRPRTAGADEIPPED
jgi:hypothetical protein